MNHTSRILRAILVASASLFAACGTTNGGAVPFDDSGTPPDNADAASSSQEDGGDGSDATTSADAGSPGDASAGDAPAGPPAPPPSGSSPDSLGYHLSGAKKFYIIGNALILGDAKVSLTVTAPASSHAIDLWMDGHFVTRVAVSMGSARLEAPTAMLAPADHVILLAEAGQNTAFARIGFTLSHPYYVFVSNDWDVPDNDPTDAVNGMQETLHQRHAELKITHFVGPYTFTDPSVTSARRQAIVNWVTGMRTSHGDEIGLHIHPYCSFVRAAGLTCLTRPSYKYASGSTQADTTGYTVVLASYTHDQMLTLLQKADALFVQNGLGKPTSFRGGGWTDEIHTLQALSDDGFVMDASGANWSRLTEWQGELLYDWNQQHWASINDTSQPYYPNTAAMLSNSPPRLPILEVPDNGILVDYITGADMVTVFDENWPGGALATPRVLSIGYHPVSLAQNPAWLDRLHQAMDHADQYLASTGNGPVFYVRGSELPKGMPIHP